MLLRSTGLVLLLLLVALVILADLRSIIVTHFTSKLLLRLILILKHFHVTDNGRILLHLCATYDTPGNHLDPWVHVIRLWRWWQQFLVEAVLPLPGVIEACRAVNRGVLPMPSRIQCLFTVHSPNIDLVFDVARVSHEARALLLHFDWVEFDAARSVSLLHFNGLEPINRLLLYLEWELLIDVVTEAVMPLLSSAFSLFIIYTTSFTFRCNMVIIIKC